MINWVSRSTSVRIRSGYIRRGWLCWVDGWRRRRGCEYDAEWPDLVSACPHRPTTWPDRQTDRHQLQHNNCNYPGEPVSKETFIHSSAIFRILWCKGKIREADAPTIWLDTALSRLLVLSLPSSPPFLRQTPFLLLPSQFILDWNWHQVSLLQSHWIGCCHQIIHDYWLIN